MSGVSREFAWIERTFLAQLAGFRGLATGEGIPFSVGKPRRSARWVGKKVWYAIRRVGNGQGSTEGLLTEGSERRDLGGREARLRPLAPLPSDNTESQQRQRKPAALRRSRSGRKGCRTPKRSLKTPNPASSRLGRPLQRRGEDRELVGGGEETEAAAVPEKEQ